MIDEYASAVAHFTDDLWAVGIALDHLAKAKGLYSTALFQPSQEVWTCLYRHLSQLLQEWLQESPELDAAHRLFALIDDDFAITVLERSVRTHLGELLLRHRVV